MLFYFQKGAKHRHPHLRLQPAVDVQTSKDHLALVMLIAPNRTCYHTRILFGKIALGITVSNSHTPVYRQIEGLECVRNRIETQLY